MACASLVGFLRPYTGEKAKLTAYIISQFKKLYKYFNKL